MRSWDSGNKVEVHTALILIKGKLEGLKAEEWSKRSGIPFQHIDRRETWSSTSKTRAQNTFTLFFTLPFQSQLPRWQRQKNKWNGWWMRAVKCCPHVSINPLWAAAGGRRADVVCVSVSTCHVKMKRKMEADSDKFEVV